MAILAELDRAGLIDTNLPTIHAPTLRDALDRWDITRNPTSQVQTFFRAAPGNVPTQRAFSQSARWNDLDTDRSAGAIRCAEQAFSKDGGLAVLFGNLAPEGCIVKTASVDPSMLVFKGKAVVFESQEATVAGILGDQVVPGDVVVIRYEGPKGGPSMHEILYPTSYLKSKALAKSCALLTDGRFSGGSSGLSIGHVSPEAAEGGLIGLVETGDVIKIDIPNRSVELMVEQSTLNQRYYSMDAKGGQAWQPAARARKVSAALQAYAALTSNAARGAVRDVTQLQYRFGSRRMPPESQQHGQALISTQD